MKKGLSMLLLIVLITQALPMTALAAIGKVLTKEELAAAYTLTGLKSDGTTIQPNAAYHKGMRPNATWNAMQISEWLDDVLKTDLFNVEDILSRASVAMARLKEKNPDAYDRLNGSGSIYKETFKNLQQMYGEAEGVREEIRYAKDFLEERANLVAQMGNQLEAYGDGMFSSERVRLSAKIETATVELDKARTEIAGRVEGWTESIQNWTARLGLLSEGGHGGTPGWFDELYSYDEGPVQNTARVVAVSASNTRMGKLSSDASLLAANDTKSELYVLSENEISIEIFAGSSDNPQPVEGVEVTVQDVRDPKAEPITRTTDKRGRIILLSNLFIADDYKKIHLKVDVNAEPLGYRSFGIEECRIKMGGSYKGMLAPLDDRPYIYSASFHGYDIWTQNFEMIYSYLIDVDFDIKVVTRNPGGEGLTPTLRFVYYKKNGGKWDLSWDYKKHFMDATAHDGNTYVFTGPWKQDIMPWLSKDQYPYFTFDGADKDPGLRYNSRLISKKSVVDKPLDAGSLALVNILKDGLSFKASLPFKPTVTFKLELPVKKLLAPDFSIDVGGNVNFCIGSPMLKNLTGKSKLNWKNDEMETLNEMQDAVKKEGWLANYKAQYALAMDFYHYEKTTILQESKINLGWFFLASGRWVTDNSIEDVKTKIITLNAGFGILLKYSYSWQMRGVLCGVPWYIAITIAINAGVDLNFEMGFSYINGSFHNWSCRPFKDITFVLGFSVIAQAGLGIKDFVDFWIRFSGGISFRIHLALMSQQKSTFSGDYFLKLTAGVTFFWSTTSVDYIDKGGPLFDSIPLSNAAPPLQQYAIPNAGPTVEKAATQEPRSYTGLVPKATQVKLSGSDQRARVRVGVLDGQTYLFYLASVTGKDKKQHMRLSWVNTADNGKTGTTQTAIDAWDTSLNGRDDYAFDVRVADGYVFLLVACAAEFDDNGLPKPNEGIGPRKECNQIFYMNVLQSNGKGNLTATLTEGYYRTGYQAPSEIGPAPVNELTDHLLVKAQPVGYTYGDVNGVYYYDSIDIPEITWARAFKEKGVSACLGVELFGTFGRVTYSEDELPYGITSFELIPGSEGVRCFSDEYVESGMGDNYVRTEVHGAMRCSNTEPKVHDANVDQHYSPGFLALSQPKDGGAGDRAIELYDFEMNGVNYGNRETVVLERGDIEHFELAQTAVDGDGTNYRRMVFYSEKETGDDGDERSRLYGLYLEPLTREGRTLTFDVTKYTYDLTIPAGGRFNLTYIGDVPYLYWLNTAPKDSEDDPDAYRIMISAYDMATNTMTDPAVYAEFQLPKNRYSRMVVDPATLRIKRVSVDLNQLPQSILLTGTGTAYLSAVSDVNDISLAIKYGYAPKSFMPKVPPVAVYSFPVQMKPILELKELFFEDTTVCVGDFEDVTVGIMNAGNMGVAQFDLELYTKEDGKVKVEETIHTDCLHPERSTLTMQGSSESEQLPDNAPVIYRESDYDYTSRQRDWVLDQEKKQYRITVGSRVSVDSVKTVDSDPQFIKTDMMMPGALASFVGTIKIPDHWNHETTLYLRVSKISTYSNWVRAMANAAGAKANGIVPNDAPEELTWVLDEGSGRMVLKTDGLSPNGLAANAVRAGIIANEVETTQDIAIGVDTQDIDVTHRIYGDSEGNDILDIIISNYTATSDSFKLTCAVYLDDEEEPYYVNLPYYAGEIADRRTQTVTLPVSALVPDMDDHHQARVVITAVGREESNTLNNEFTLDLGMNNLRVTEQPEDQTVQEGEDVTFTVVVGGGVKPYSYQWQVWDEKHQKWVDLPGFTEPKLSRKDIEKKWDGARFRCVITDSSGAQVITDAVTLTVRDGVDTGDHSNLPLYLAVALAALALLWLVRRRTKQMG